MASIFLSHNSEDKEFVRALHEFLKEEGIKSWIDEAEIKIGDSLLGKINEGINKADYLAIILSPRSIKSNWVKYELERAMTMEINQGKTKVLPILIENCEVPECIQYKKWGDFRTPAKVISGMKDLLERLNENKKEIKIDEKKEITPKRVMKTKKEMNNEKISEGEYNRFRKLYDDAVRSRNYGGMGLNEKIALILAKGLLKLPENRYNRFRKLYDDAVRSRNYGGMGLDTNEALKFASENL
jgi:hypothetical protein